MKEKIHFENHQNDPFSSFLNSSSALHCNDDKTSQATSFKKASTLKLSIHVVVSETQAIIKTLVHFVSIFMMQLLPLTFVQVIK